ADIHRPIPQRLRRPDRAVLWIGRDGSGWRTALVPCNPGLPSPEIHQDPVAAVLLAGPWLGPLIGVHGPQPVGSLVDKADDHVKVAFGGPTEQRRNSHVTMIAINVAALHLDIPNGRPISDRPSDRTGR